MSRDADEQFAVSVGDPGRHAVADFSPNSRSLLILFGGIAGGVSMPVFEFFRVTAGYPVKRLFLRDPLRAWYLRGLPGVGTDAAALAGALRGTIAAAGVERVVMAGASAGGFAAVLFGSWLRVDRVIAFSPQSFVDAPNRRAAGDDRWAEQIAALHGALGPEHALYDLRGRLAGSDPLPALELHVGGGDALDVAHARRLADLPGATLVEYDGGGHRLVRWLRDSGRLEPILLHALGLVDDGRSGAGGGDRAD
ncbi:MAG: hypothetical protein IT337_13815 [Thermomicrobiales bacterium]|nr:hypothetical protein [Thermomicrobiales bacterium]